MLIQKKLQQMKEKSMKKKSNKKDSLFESLRGEASKIALLEEKLHKICGVICGLQNETLLQQMVNFIYFLQWRHLLLSLHINSVINANVSEP